MNKALLTILVLLFISPIFAQTFKCGTDYYDSIEVANDPSILQKRMELENFTQRYVNSNFKADETYIIPIVFHVLHQYGEERISLKTIKLGVEQINKDYNAGNLELNSIVSSFKEIIGNVNIKFVLAKKDPDGNCTTGVVYYDTKLTYNASNDLKNTIKSWDSESYLNIWTVKTIESGAAAWSHYPGVTASKDGIVSIYRYINSHTLGHETGHYLNLAHPWGSTNEPGLQSNCDIDDNVDDTPLTIGADQHCNLDQISCGSLDNIQNFMDYTTCDAMFTAGQAERMRAALNSTAGGRKYLWTEANLLATGTNDDYEVPECEPVADFLGTVAGFIPGDSLQFNDYSYGAEPTFWKWTFEGGTPSESVNQSPFVTYKKPGYYRVSLTAGNSVGENTLSRENLVFVTDTLKGIIAPAIVDMEDVNFPDYEDDIFKMWNFENSGNYNWELYRAENSAMRIKNYGNSTDVVNSMITSNINLSEIDNPNYLYIDYAYAQKNDASEDEMKIFVSPDGGKKWIIRVIKKGKSLVTSNGEYVVDDFIPNSDEWRQEKIDISNYKANNFLKVKIQMKSRGGNYFYIDNLNVGKTVDLLSNRSLENNLKIYPNPAKSEVKVEYFLKNNTNVTLQITNILGVEVYRNVLAGISGKNIQMIDISHLNINEGIYLVSFINNSVKQSKRLVIQ